MEDKSEKKPVEKQVPSNKIRITLTGQNAAHLEHVSSLLVKKAKENPSHPKIKGPVPMPTKILRITTRKTTCGEGSKTWDRFEMRIHKRIIEFITTVDTVKDIINVTIDAGVDVDVALLKVKRKQPAPTPSKGK